jgi:rod shape-determining protein MreC
MAGRQVRFSRRMLVTWLVLASGIIFLAPERVTGRMQLAFAGIFRWPLKVGRVVSLSAQTEESGADEIERLKSQYGNHIQNLDMELKEAYERVDKLSGLRNRLPWGGVRFIAADISRLSLEGPKNEMFINRGRDDGVRDGCYVLGDNSVVGVVAETAGGTSKVRLVTDADSRIAVTIGNLNIETLLDGFGNGFAKAQLVPREHKVKKGDKVFALKRGGALGSPIIVGEVVEVKRDDFKPLIWDITVRPVCGVEGLADVAVVVMGRDKLEDI